MDELDKDENYTNQSFEDIKHIDENGIDIDISKIKFQEDEVSDVKWATWTEINDLVSSGKFIKHRWEFVSKLLEEEIEL